jgi:hypothetical protein
LLGDALGVRVKSGGAALLVVVGGRLLIAGRLRLKKSR